MASTASLVFSVIARFTGDRAIQRGNHRLQRMRRIVGGIAFATPAATAATATLTAGIGALTAATAGATAGLGAFSLAVAPQVKQMSKNADMARKLADAKADAANKVAIARKMEATGHELEEKALKSADAARLKAIQLQRQFRKETAGMPKATVAATLSLAEMRTAWEDWSNKLSPETMPLFTKTFNALKETFPAMTPLVRTTTAALDIMVNRFAGYVEGGGFAKFMMAMRNSAKTTLPNLLTAGRNFFVGLGGIIKAFLPLGNDFSDSLVRWSADFADWGQSLGKTEGFKNFIAYVRENAPTVGVLLGDIFNMAIALLQAFAPFLGVTTQLALAFARLIDATPQPVLTALIGVYVALVIAVKAYALYQGIAAGVTWAFTTAVTTHTGAVYSSRAALVAARLATIGHAIATGASATASGIAAAATWVWTGAMRALSLAFWTSPIGLIVLGITALVAAIVLIATKTTWFQTMWDAVWKGIRAGITWIVDGFKWLWNVLFGHSIVPDIVNGFQVAWGILKSIFDFWIATVKLVGKIFMWLWKNAVLPALKGIRFLVQTYIKFVVLYFKTWIKIIRTLGDVFVWLWKQIVKVAMTAIRGIIKTVWFAIRTYLNLWKTGLRLLADVVKWLWKNVTKPAFNGIRGIVESVWKRGIRPAFNAIKDGARSVADGFRKAKDGIKVAWERLKGITKGPVRFFVETVYNKGLRSAWNKTAGKLPGVPDLPAANLPRGFAKGGPVRGPGGSTGDRIPAMLSAGEYVIRAAAVKKVGVNVLNWLNNEKGRFTTGDRSNPYGFAFGGLVGDAIGGALGKVGGSFAKGFDWAQDLTRDIAGKVMSGFFSPFRKLINGLVDRFPGAGMVNDLIKSFVNQGFDKMLEFVKGKAPEGVGGPAVQKALKWAKGQEGKPYVWGGVGPGGYDCSGYMSAIQNVIQGRNPYSRLWTTHSFRNGTPSGWALRKKSGFEVGITHSGVGHTGGTLGGVDVESSGGVGVRVGPSARGSHDRMFPYWYGLKYDQGGLLPTGWSMAYNGTGKPEPVGHDLTDKSAAPEFHFHAPVYAKSKRDFEDMFVEAFTEAKKKGRIKP